MATYQEIIDYCIDYSNRTTQEDGSIAIRDPTNVESIGIDFNRLTREEARGLAVGLSYTLIHGQMNAVVMQDHKRFWDAVGKHLLEPPSLYFGESFKTSKPFPVELYYLRQLFITVIKTETREWEIFEIRNISGWIWPRSVRGYPADAVSPGEYFVYPLLEAVVKRLLRRFVAADGQVTSEFIISFSNGNSKKYQVGHIVSQISHFLLLLLQESKDAELIDELNFLFTKIQNTYQGRSAIDIISNEWRNSALHGQPHTPTASGIVLNIVLLLAIASVSEQDWLERYNV